MHELDHRIGRLPDLTEVVPVSDEDHSCLSEVREVLRRHDALGRFGITLLHDHFPIGQDEVLVETVDVERRTLTINPVPRSSLEAEKTTETSWRLDVPTALLECRVQCLDEGGGPGTHAQVHQHL